MKEYLNIREMSVLRNVTVETLRHYDRANVLKPDFIDHNKIRYYHVSKAETIRTIKELQEIGMSLREIKAYLQERNINSSYELLLEKQEFIRNQYEFYKSLNKTIKSKINFLKKFHKSHILDQVYEKFIPERCCIFAKQAVTNDVELFHMTTELEKYVESLEGYLQIYASQRYGTIFQMDTQTRSNRPFLLVDDSNNAHKIEAGLYLCVLKSGSFWEIEQHKQLLLEYAQKHNYTVSNELFSIVQIDYTLSDHENERVYELQLKIKN